MSVIGRGI